MLAQLKQSTGTHVAPFRKHSDSEQLNRCSYSIVLRAQIQCYSLWCLIRLGLEPMMYRTRGKYNDPETTDR